MELEISIAHASCALLLDKLSQLDTLEIAMGNGARLLYHYTSLDALVAIIESGTIWASDLRFLNDGREFIYALDIIQEAVARIGPEKLEDYFLTRLCNSLTSTKASMSAFVASFSEYGDLLSQWRAYCPPGRGVSIGLEEKSLKEACAAQGFRLVQCLYDGEQHMRVATDLVEEVIEASYELEDGPEVDHDADCGELISVFLASVVHHAPAMKDTAFAEEHEWRVVRGKGRGSRAEDQYRAGKSFIIPFVNFKLPTRDGRLDLGEIVIGPTPHPELSNRAIVEMLGSRRITFNTAIVRSSVVPYRAW